MDELFAGQVPVGVNPATQVPLDLELLRQLSREFLVENGYGVA